MSIREDATRIHEQGFNCAQSVLAACGKYTGLDEETAFALTGGFGGGVCCGEICGAVSGGVMAIGLANPHTDCEDKAAKATVRRLTMSYTKQFSEQFGCIRCFDLKRSGHPCPELINYAAELAEKMILENPKYRGEENGNL